VGEHDVGGEERGVREREADPGRAAGDLDMRQQVHAGGRRGDGDPVVAGARAGDGERDRPQELDGGDRRERQAIDGEVEADVHAGEDGAEARDQQAGSRVDLAQAPPGPPPRREDEGGRGDAHPGDAEHVDAGEQEHREGWAQVVEDGAPGEVRLRRHRSGREAPRHGGKHGPKRRSGPAISTHTIDGLSLRYLP